MYLDLTLGSEQDENNNAIDTFKRECSSSQIQADIRNMTARQRQKQLISGAMIIVVVISLTIVMKLYRKKRMSKDPLALQLKKWADEKDTKEASLERSRERNEKTFSDLQQIMVDKELYKDPSITLESLAKRMKISRNRLSHAINKCAGKNFNQYINEYRIKEALSLMSENKNLFVDEIGREVGFNSRSSFYRIFKNTTGFEPSKFKREKVDFSNLGH